LSQSECWRPCRRRTRRRTRRRSRATVDTVGLAKNKVTIKRGDGTNITLGVKGFTKVSRNSVPTTLSGLALSDTITAQYFGAFALKLTVTGPAVTTTSGPVVVVNTGPGVLTIGSTSVFTNANSKICRNGKVVSLGKLTLHDTAVVHSSSSGVNSQEGDDADDVVANGPGEGEVKGTIGAIAGSQVTITPEGVGTP